jgi:hypothetical protein
MVALNLKKSPCFSILSESKGEFVTGSSGFYMVFVKRKPGLPGFHHVELFLFLQELINRCRSCLTVHGFLRIKLNVRKPYIRRQIQMASKIFQHPANIQIVIKCGLWLQPSFLIPSYKGQKPAGVSMPLVPLSPIDRLMQSLYILLLLRDGKAAIPYKIKAFTDYSILLNAPGRSFRHFFSSLFF